MHSRTKGFLVHGLVFAMTACGQWDNEQQHPVAASEPPSATDPLLLPIPPAPPEPSQPVLPETSLPPVIPISTDQTEEPDDSINGSNRNSGSSDVQNNVTALTRALAEPTGMLLSESDSVADFLNWISEEKNKTIVSQIGSFDAVNKVLSLKSPVTLSFSSFAAGGPLVIKSNGHDITLVGDDFGYLKVDSSKPNGHSGHVRVFSTAKVLPSVVTSGATGAGGGQGQCPADLSCAGIGEQIARRPLLAPSVATEKRVVEYQWDWSDNNMPEVVRQQALALLAKPSDSFFKQHCSQSSYVSWVDGPFISGKIKLKQWMIDPLLPAGLTAAKPIDALVYSGERGNVGFDAGNVTVVQFGDEDKKWVDYVIVNGGEGGLGGRNVMSPPSEAVEEIRHFSQKLAERLHLENLSMEYRVECRGFGSFPHSWQSKVALPPITREVAAKTEILADSKTVVLPAVPAGRDLPTDTAMRAEQGASGKAGQRDLIRAQTPEQWKSAIHSSIPLPRKIQAMFAGR